jgi:hypothetical protein
MNNILKQQIPDLYSIPLYLIKTLPLKFCFEITKQSQYKEEEKYVLSHLKL